MNTFHLAYLICYLGIVVLVILRVGHLLHQSGRIYLNNLFSHSLPLAKSVNDLLLVGYYLVNIGYSVFVLTFGMGELNPDYALE